MTAHRSSVGAAFCCDVEPAGTVRHTASTWEVKTQARRDHGDPEDLRGAHLEAFLILLRFLRDDPPVLVEDLLHPPVPLEHAVVEPDVRRGEGGALDEEGEAVLRVHQSASQINHVDGLYFLNVSLRETKVTDSVFVNCSLSKNSLEKHTA